MSWPPIDNKDDKDDKDDKDNKTKPLDFANVMKPIYLSSKSVAKTSSGMTLRIGGMGLAGKVGICCTSLGLMVLCGYAALDGSSGDGGNGGQLDSDKIGVKAWRVGFEGGETEFKALEGRVCLSRFEVGEQFRLELSEAGEGSEGSGPGEKERLEGGEKVFAELKMPAVLELDRPVMIEESEFDRLLAGIVAERARLKDLAAEKDLLAKKNKGEEILEQTRVAESARLIEMRWRDVEVEEPTKWTFKGEDLVGAGSVSGEVAGSGLVWMDQPSLESYVSYWREYLTKNAAEIWVIPEGVIGGGENSESSVNRIGFSQPGEIREAAKEGSPGFSLKGAVILGAYY